jgi:hypothetical protein
MQRLIIRQNGTDISNDCRFANGKANPFGWSAGDIVHDVRVGGIVEAVRIGTYYCGDIKISEPGYTHEIIEEP